MKARCSACQTVASRVITEEDSPAAEPKKPSSAGTKSPVDSLCGQKGQHLGDLRGPPAPRRADLGRKLGFGAGLLVDGPVVHPRGPDAYRSGDGLDAWRLGMPVTGHRGVAVLVPLAGELGR